MADKEIIINSLLCFINSAVEDYDIAALLDVVRTFYSHEEIKKSKEILCGLLAKDLVWRRDPDKKGKDLRDLLEFHNELNEAKMKVKFVTDSYKTMPPVGLQVFAPVLTNLSEEIAKINDLLPKILDIKSEVLNTADAVRDIKIDMCDIKTKFASAITGMEEAARDITINDLKDMEDMRMNMSEPGRNVHVIRDDARDTRSYAEAASTENVGAAWSGGDGRTSAMRCSIPVPEQGGDGHRQGTTTAVRLGSVLGPNGESKRADRPTRRDEDVWERVGAPTSTIPMTGVRTTTPSTKVSDPSTGAITKNLRASGRVDERHHSMENSEWTVVKSRNERKRENSAQKRNYFRGITGSRKTENITLKAATRFVDLFLGRVDREVTGDNIHEYVSNTFGVNIVDITKLEILSDKFSAFKITVRLQDREKLFQADLWPEDIVIDKFYNRVKKSVNGPSSTA